MMGERLAYLMQLYRDGDMAGEEYMEFAKLIIEEEEKYEKFYLTFGVQYAREPHPRGAHVHPDGYVVITARDHVTARDMVVQLYGRNWSGLYTEDGFSEEDRKQFYPRGVLLNVQVPRGD